MTDPRARRMWALFEPVHDVTYFAERARRHADRLGVSGFWAGYVVQRVAPLGPVGVALATALFHGFHRDRLAQTLPAVWEVTTPAAALEARALGADAALRELWGDAVAGSAGVARAADLAWQAAAAADCAGRPLAAANQALPRPSTALCALWQATTTLREHRGDGHVAALVVEGVGAVESHLIKAAAGEADGEGLRLGRKFSVEAWEAGVGRLRERGVLDPDGRLTPAGRAVHDRIESATDEAADQPWRALGEAGTAELAELLAPLSAAVVAAGIPPAPNAVGLVTEGAR